MQGVPLLEEQILDKAEEADFLFQFVSGIPDGIGISEFQVMLPLVPGLAAEFVFQRHEQGEIGQPVAVLLRKAGVVLARGEAGVGLAQHVQAVAVQQAEVSLVIGHVPLDAFQVGLGKQTILHQTVEVNQIVVPGEGGAGLIGGVAVAGGSQGQNLPIALAGFFQKVNEFVCFAAHGAHAVRTGQTGDVHQNAAGSHIIIPHF